MLTDSGRVPIGRRAWIGDGLHGALVGPDGTIDWYGGLTGNPLLWRLLDPAGPALRVGPVREGTGTRWRPPSWTTRFRAGTNVAETIMTAAGGRAVAVVDFIGWEGPGRPADGRLFRLIRALAGPVEVEVEFLPGPDRGMAGEDRSVVCAGGRLVSGDLEINAGPPFHAEPVGRTERWRATAVLKDGEEMGVVVGSPDSPDGIRRRLQETETAWRSWLGSLVYAGPHRAAVERAALSLKVLTGPTGAAQAAGTTSLPRRLGSERNSDDRWVRLRDVARSVPVLANAGLAEDAEAAEAWLRTAVEEMGSPWPMWLDRDWHAVPGLDDLSLTGWRGSGPVWLGRVEGLFDQGLVGDVISSVGASQTGPGATDPGGPGPLHAVLGSLGRALDDASDRWHEPDNGIWEIERPTRAYTSSRVRLWTGFDRLSRLVSSLNPLDLGAAGWRQDSRDIRAWLEATAKDGILPMAPGTEETDSALLALSGAGPWSLTDPMVATNVGRVLERLVSGGLLYRYSDRVSDERAGPDLPDLSASLDGAGALARLGRWDESHEALEAVLSILGDGPGVLGETADPMSREMFGNVPCAASAVSLIDATFALELGPR